MILVLLSGDLMAASRVQGAASKIEGGLHTVSNAELVIACCREEPVRLVIVDLALPGLEIEPLINSLKRGDFSPPRIIAFGPHVHEQRLAAARRAGCDEVVSRGQFFAQLESILSRHTM
jgi:DNA-binding NarL/FixJ family response regulator